MPTKKPTYVRGEVVSIDGRPAIIKSVAYPDTVIVVYLDSHCMSAADVDGLLEGYQNLAHNTGLLAAHANIANRQPKFSVGDVIRKDGKTLRIKEISFRRPFSEVPFYYSMSTEATECLKEDEIEKYIDELASSAENGLERFKKEAVNQVIGKALRDDLSE